MEGNVYCLPPFTRAHHTQLPFAYILQGRTIFRMTDYDSLHRQCRTLESLFDTKLTSYSRLATTITRHQDDVEAGGSVERWKDLEAEVDELLQKVCMNMLSHLEGNLNYYVIYQLGELNDQLSKLSSDPDTPPSQSMLRAIQRHREVYQDYSRELKRTKVRLHILFPRMTSSRNRTSVDECTTCTRPSEPPHRCPK